MKKSCKTLFLIICAVMLMIHSQTVAQYAKEGISLCLWTVIPSMFPLMMICSICCHQFRINKLTLPCIPKNFEGLLIPAFLGGYPLGAQTVGQAYKDGTLSKSQAERLLSFCSNAGPSFLFGIVSAQFDHIAIGWILWGIQIISAAIVAFTLPQQPSEPTTPAKRKELSLAQLLRASLRSMADICGWILLFSVVLGFFSSLIQMLPSPMAIALTGILELTKGCCQLRMIENTALRFIVASAMNSFGGVCVLLQTISVCNGLSIRPYLKGKCKQTLIAILLSLAITDPLAAIIESLIGLFCILRKNSRFFNLRRV